MGYQITDREINQLLRDAFYSHNVRAIALCTVALYGDHDAFELSRLSEDVAAGVRAVCLEMTQDQARQRVAFIFAARQVWAP